MEKTIQEQIAEREERMAARRAVKDAARDAQYLKDLDDIEQLGEQFGEDRTKILRVPSFIEGLPTSILVVTPEPKYWKRYKDLVRRAKGDHEKIGAAQDQLADVSVAYPDSETFAKMLEHWPGIRDDVALEAIKLGEASGKG